MKKYQLLLLIACIFMAASGPKLLLQVLAMVMAIAALYFQSKEK